MSRSGELAIEVRSNSLTELFQDVARQLFAALINPDDISMTLREKVAIEGESLEHLLQEWVEILLNMVTGQRMLFNSFKIDLKIVQKGPYYLKAEALGELFDPQRHKLRRPLEDFRGFHATLRSEGQEYRAEILLAK